MREMKDETSVIEKRDGDLKKKKSEAVTFNPILCKKKTTIYVYWLHFNHKTARLSLWLKTDWKGSDDVFARIVRVEIV